MLKTPKEKEQEIIAFYKNGNSMAKTGKFFGISAVTVKNILERNGIQKRTKGGIYALPEKEIIKKYQSGISTTIIANEYNVTIHTITNLLERNNIKRNNRYQNINLDIDYFEKIDTIDKAYFLGLLLTDGNVGADNNTISISLQEKDVEILKIFSEQIKSENQLYYRKDKPEVRMSLKSAKMKKDLEQYGVIPRKTATVEMPFLGEEMMPHLIRGMIDGDGWISEKSHQLGFCGNEKTVTQFKNYLVTLLKVYDVKVLHTGEHLWQITWASKKDIIKICSYIYKDKNKFFLKRKYQNFLKIQGNTEITDQITKG